MRVRLALACAAALLGGAACAHVEAPPGGEVDQEAPVLETTRPDTFARMRSYLGPVLFSFNEGISEKGIDTVATVSPRTSPVVVDKSGREVRVSLRRGWEPNRVYQVTLGRGVQDLFGNATKEPVTVVFSTGPEIVHTLATGTVIERTTLRPATGARIEAIHQPDSVLYETRPDSAGSWRLEYLPEGDYRIRAYNDTNKDAKLQPYEPFDTATLRVTRRDTARVRRLALLAPDSTPPKAGSATGQDSVIEVRFDDFLDPAQPLTPAQVTVTGPGGAVRVAAVRVGAPAAEAGAASADSTGGTAAAAGAVRDTARRPTAAAPPEPVPSQSLVVRLAAPLAPDAQYTVNVTGVRNLRGLVGGGQVQFRTARAAAPPPAPAPARGDSAGARRPPPAAPGAPRPAPQPPRPQTAPTPVATPPRDRR